MVSTHGLDAERSRGRLWRMEESCSLFGSEELVAKLVKAGCPQTFMHLRPDIDFVSHQARF